MYINKEMIDEERYNLLKNKMLSVVKWDKSKEIQITDPDESISHAIRRHANELGIIGQKLQLEGMEIYPVFTMKAVKESESIMRKRNENIADLSKLFTVLPAVAKNAILLEIEEYRHMSSRRPTDIFNMSHYLSGFHDGDLFYPVKISVSNRSDNNNTSIKMTITVGKISLSTFEKEKRSETDTNMHSMNEESSSVWPASFNISITELIKNFNKSESIILKNLPDNMLSDYQKGLKDAVKEYDAMKEREFQYKEKNNKNILENEDIETAEEELPF